MGVANGVAVGPGVGVAVGRVSTVGVGGIGVDGSSSLEHPVIATSVSASMLANQISAVVACCRS